MKQYFLTRQALEEREKQILAPYALKNSESRGRIFFEELHPYRLAFARDRDRILYTKAFRRLKGKTQVFVASHGDHFRSRLTHTLEVAQIARTIARTLNANEDLVEAVALSHDLGHTPFGHAGEHAMRQMMQKFGKDFEHNAQSRRILEVLESHPPHERGLNLSIEILDCLWKHPTDEQRQKNNLPKQNFFEGQIVDLSDEIAYLSHDIDDGIQSQLIDLNDLEGVFLWRNISSNEKERRVSKLINLMVENLVQESATRLQKLNPKNSDDICDADQFVIGFSPEFLKHVLELRKFLYQKFYKNPIVMEQTKYGEHIVENLFKYFVEHPEKLPENNNNMADPLAERVKDFIAGMTDTFAIDFFDTLT
jgi:dGTPase